MGVVLLRIEPSLPATYMNHVLAAIFRLLILFMALAGLALLFFYAFIAALFITPILFVLIYFFGRKNKVQWTVVRPHAHTGASHPDQGYDRGPHRQGPVIDHDPGDLPK